MPIEPIELYLAEFHILAISLEKTLNSFKRAVSGKTEMLYPSLSLLLNQIIVYSIPRIEVFLNVMLGNVVEKIKVELVHLTSFDLILDDLLDSADRG